MKINPYQLYNNKENLKEVVKATREITREINKKNWKGVKSLQKKYKLIGANDTDSTDRIVEKWFKKYKKAPSGIIYYGEKY